ncbi:hypothetical protein VUR80DRAFT_7784 [Thermomyces stellatus]
MPIPLGGGGVAESLARNTGRQPRGEAAARPSSSALGGLPKLPRKRAAPRAPAVLSSPVRGRRSGANLGLLALRSPPALGPKSPLLAQELPPLTPESLRLSHDEKRALIGAWFG